MFKKILVANRGEIAVRIIRSCRELGIPAVAVYSEADRTSLHVTLADEAYFIGLAPSSESYLRMDRLIAAAKKCGADAIHPGYGFLSENSDFAEACRKAKITFIGPSPKALSLLGNKVRARATLKKSGIPLIPGSIGALQSLKEALGEAEKIGYPILIKAAAGGGGRGIRVVYYKKDLAFSLESARRESQKAFGSGEIYLEKYFPFPRHIEVQILADRYGHCIHLHERECSVQRRHQKIIEETPSPAIAESARVQMGKTAVKIAEIVHYEGAGTIEFILNEDGKFYFLEVNARLQVEHPITEIVTGVDLVKWQILIAAGEPLTLQQKEIKPRGAAIECRICAEDPLHDFAPSPGKITHLQTPGGPSVRIDSALYRGWEVPMYYDALLAKLCTWGKDRNEAISRMQRALRELVILGVKSNIAFLMKILESPEFQSGRYDTKIVEKVLPAFIDEKEVDDFHILAAVAAAIYAYHAETSTLHQVTVQQLVQSSPWKEASRSLAVNIRHRLTKLPFIRSSPRKTT